MATSTNSTTTNRKSLKALLSQGKPAPQAYIPWGRTEFPAWDALGAGRAFNPDALSPEPLPGEFNPFAD